jgi:HK97 family phage major capsid protein
MNTLKNLREQRAKASEELDAIQALCDKEQRGRNDEERTKWATLKKKIADLDADILDFEAQEEDQKRSAKPIVKKDEDKADKKDEAEKEEVIPSVRAQIKEWIKRNKPVLDEMRSGNMPSKLDGMELRVPFTMTVAATNSGSSVYLPNSGAIQGAVNDLNRTKPTFWNQLKKGRTGLNPYVWVNKTNKQGNATFIGEGVLKPLVSFELTVESSVPKKVAERFRVSTELLHDIDGMQTLIEQEARFEVEVAANTAVLTGTASSTSPAGITTIASAFTLTTVDVQLPNNFDAIRAAVAQLQTLNFDRDIVAFVNPIDAAEMDMAKGSDGHYVLPPFISQSGTVVKGVRIIEDNNIAVGNLLIGDMSKYKILMYQDFHVRWGLDSDDFSKNLITMIAEMRFHQFFGANDAGAFIYDSFADIKAAIITT